MQRRRRFAAQPLEQVRRGGGAVELVHVLDDEDELTARPLGERLAHQARCRLHAHEHVRLGLGPPGGVRCGQLVGKVRDTETQSPE